jgi:uridylate kinase
VKVLALGGSVIGMHKQEIPRLADAASDFDAIVTGAGPLAHYIEHSTGNEASKDLIGIKATRLHAQTVAVELEDSNSSIPTSFQELTDMTERFSTVVSGGMVPGYSTDAVAATAAELLDADLYIATDVDGIYDRHPDKEKAQMLDEASVNKLREMTEGISEAGGYALIDRTALDIIDRSDITTKVFKGEPRRLEQAETCSGTRIR